MKKPRKGTSCEDNSTKNSVQRLPPIVTEKGEGCLTRQIPGDDRKPRGRTAWYYLPSLLKEGLLWTCTATDSHQTTAALGDFGSGSKAVLTSPANRAREEGECMSHRQDPGSARFEGFLQIRRGEKCRAQPSKAYTVLSCQHNWRVKHIPLTGDIHLTGCVLLMLLYSVFHPGSTEFKAL